MKTPLIPDTHDFKWILLDLILGLLRSRRGSQIIAKYGISPAKCAYHHLAILILSLISASKPRETLSDTIERICDQYTSSDYNEACRDTSCDEWKQGIEEQIA